MMIGTAAAVYINVRRSVTGISAASWSEVPDLGESAIRAERTRGEMRQNVDLWRRRHSHCGPRTITLRVGWAKPWNRAVTEYLSALDDTAFGGAASVEPKTISPTDAFAHLKRILRLGRLRPRGPNGAKDEFPLAATAQNRRRLAKLIAHPAPIFAT
jgi:hypothetical protein